MWSVRGANWSQLYQKAPGRDEMNLFISRADYTDQDEGLREYSSIHPRSQEESIDFYKKYEDETYAPIEGHTHSQNLFDDLDTKDKYWFDIARKFLKNSRLSGGRRP